MFLRRGPADFAVVACGLFGAIFTRPCGVAKAHSQNLRSDLQSITRPWTVKSG